MEKYIIAPPAGSQTNALGAEDRPWEEVHANRYPGINEYLAESTGYGIVSGCEPSINGMTVTVSAGVIHTADGRRVEVPEQSITLDAADATKPRTDVVYLDAAGKVQKKTGELSEANSTPAMPEMQESDRVLAVVAACDLKADNVTLLDRRSMKDEISYGQAIYKAGLKLRYTIGLSLHDMRNNVINDFPKKGYYVMRDDIDWVYVEQSKGVYTYDKYLNQLKAYKNAGVKGDCIFTFNNKLYQLEGESNNCTYNAERADAYKKFVLNFIKYMKEQGITGLIIEIINEANFPVYFYATEDRVKHYVNIAKSLYQDIKSIDKTTTVVTCNFAVGEGNSVRSLSELDAALSYGIADYSDAIGIHPYTSGKPERMSEYYGYLKTLIKKVHHLDIPIICDEIGYSVCDNYVSGGKILASESDRKNYIPRVILNNLKNNITLTCIYCYRKTGADSSTNSEELFGIYNMDGTKTSTAIAIENLVDLIGDMVYAGVYEENQNSQVLQFVNKNGLVSYVMWAYDENETVVVNNRQYTLDESPIFVRDCGCKIRDYDESVKELDSSDITSNIILSKNTLLDTDSSFNDGNIAKDDNNIICGLNNTACGYSIVNGRNNYCGEYSVVKGISNIACGASKSKVQKINSVDDKKIYVSNPTVYTTGEECLIHVPWGNTIKGKIIKIETDYVEIEASSIIPSNSSYILGLLIKNGEPTPYHQIAVGSNCISTGINAFVGSNECIGNGGLSFTYGEGLINSISFSAMFGKHNNINATGLMVIGNGTGAAKSNVFRVTEAGAVYGQSAYNSTGADYAEYFEWADGNVDNEDRVGFFVTVDGNKIRVANGSDKYILGIISGAPAMIGNSYNDQWRNMYVTDVFGRVQYENVTVPTETDGNGNVIHEEHVEKRACLKPDYDANQTYEGREKRKEWSAVGMLGVLPVRDDGTCEVNGYCKVADGGIATKANSGYRVVARVADNIIKVLFR